MKPDVLGDGSDWENLSPEPDPGVVEALKSLTLTVNHNNTISVGFEKDQVVGVLLALHDAHVPIDADAMQGWAPRLRLVGQQPRAARRVRPRHQQREASPDPAGVKSDFVNRMRELTTTKGAANKNE